MEFKTHELLYNMASEVMKNFDPATDLVDDFEEIPDGTYECIIEKVTHKENEKGTNWISIDCSIIDDNRHLFVNYFFTEKTMMRSIKAINKLAFNYGFDIGLDSYYDYDILSYNLNSIAGTKCTVTKKTSTNGFANCKIEPITTTPGAGATGGVIQ